MKLSADAKKALSAPELCERAARLRASGLSYLEIGALMQVSAIIARDLARRHERNAEWTKALNGPVTLPPRAVLNLVVGKYAATIATDLETRLQRLTDIASAYTWDELLAEEGIGRKTARIIRLWLESQGLALRPELPPVADAPQVEIARFRRRKPAAFVTRRKDGYTPSSAHHRRRA